MDDKWATGGATHQCELCACQHGMSADVQAVLVMGLQSATTVLYLE